METAYDELVRNQAQVLVETERRDGSKFEIFMKKMDESEQAGEKFAPYCITKDDRDEFDAMREAMPDLIRLERHERRALSRLMRAISNFTTIRIRANPVSRN